MADMALYAIGMRPCHVKDLKLLNHITATPIHPTTASIHSWSYWCMVMRKNSVTSLHIVEMPVARYHGMRYAQDKGYLHMLGI